MTRKNELKIYYLFMLVNGECSEGENDRFDSLCKEYNIDSSEKKEIISESEKVLETFGNRFDLIKEEICKIVDENTKDFFSFFYSCDKKRLIWTLLNLGYADEEFSDIEKNIVDLLATNFKLEKVDYEEMIDSAETILSLVKEKEWLKTTRRPYDEVTNKIAKTDEAIKHLYENIELLITE